MHIHMYVVEPSKNAGNIVVSLTVNALHNTYHEVVLAIPIYFFKFIYYGLPGMTQLTRKSPIALGLILRGSPGPTA